MLSTMAVLIGGLLAIGFGLLSLVLLQPKWLFTTLESISPRVVYYVETDQPIVALTIDDGPDPLGTPALLQTLARFKAQATFFLVSDRVDGQEHLVEQIIQEGHEIGNHLKEEAASIKLTPAQFEEALIRSHEKLSQFSNLYWFRPGSGWYNQRMLKTISQYGYRCALGSLYPYDAQHASTWFSQLQILNNIFPGGIIILHDRGIRGLRAAEVLEKILPELAQRGYHITTLSNLVISATE